MKFSPKWPLSFLLLFLIQIAQGQNHANTWMLGYSFCPTCAKVGVSFPSNLADTFSVFRSMQVTNAIISVSDTFGHLLFYSNGVWLANKNHDSLKNSQSFNPGYLTDYNSTSGLGMRWFQEILTLPLTNRPDTFYVFSQSGEKVSTPNVSNDLQPLSLTYSVIDMKGDGGLGEMILKAKDAVKDTLTAGRLTACKHANGRDWWVVSHEYNTDKFYLTFVTPDSVYAPIEQHIGVRVDEFDLWGQACFSPDGNKYAMINTNDTCMLLDFDRCTGTFSNPRNLALNDSGFYLSCQFSSNGRFLYAASYTHIYQFDTDATDIPSSVELVATLLPYTGIPKYFSMMQLAPDGRIYIAPYNGWNFLHYIENPDSLGLVCAIAQEGFILPSYHGGGLPNQVNYDLGALVASPCDTLTSINETKTPTNRIRIYPNPATEIVNMVYQINSTSLFELTDAAGTVRKKITLYPYFKNRMIWVSDLENGIYFYSVVSNSEVLQTGKIAVVR